VVVLDRGRVAAAGTPLQLKSALGGESVDVLLRDRSQLPTAADALRSVGIEPRVEPDQGRLHVLAEDGVATLIRTARALQDVDIAVEDIAMRRPTLDEVFLSLTTGSRTPWRCPDDRDDSDSGPAEDPGRTGAVGFTDILTVARRSYAQLRSQPAELLGFLAFRSS